MALSMKPIASARLCSPCNVCAQRAPTVYATQQYRAFQSQSRAGISLGTHSLKQRHVILQAVATLEDAPTQLDVSKMEPLGDRILIKPEEEKSVTEGGLMLTTGATKTISDAVIGQVLAKGEDVDISVSVGDKVIFQKYSSSDVKVPDGEIVFVAQKSVLAVLT
ncbi:g10701 [Coccomyxa viridis]|uniref:G10701 protein n=1 Tax=Coccomyxa viridis TaxID=1274662 RepID=A0ABP1GBZ8_9CHLO